MRVLHRLIVLTFIAVTATTVLAEETLTESQAKEKIQQLGGEFLTPTGPMGVEVAEECEHNQPM